MERMSYPDDLKDIEWKWIEPFIQADPLGRGRRPLHSKRELLNAIFYLLRTGCSWRNLPHDFPPWKTVYTQFRRWRHTDFFTRLHDELRKKLRSNLGRKAEASAAIVDSQSVKTTEKGGRKG